MLDAFGGSGAGSWFFADSSHPGSWNTQNLYRSFSMAMPVSAGSALCTATPAELYPSTPSASCGGDKRENRYSVRDLHVNRVSRHATLALDCKYCMNRSNKKLLNGINSILPCPLCAASGHLTFEGVNPTHYGIRCRSCGTLSSCNR